MPIAASRPCDIPGCPRLAPPRKARCEPCRRAAAEQRGTRTTRGYDGRWLTFRARYLRRHPICAEPGCTRPATDIDHIDGRGPLGPRGFDQGNLRPLCHQHHSRRTARDQPGGWNATA